MPKPKPNYTLTMQRHFNKALPQPFRPFPEIIGWPAPWRDEDASGNPIAYRIMLGVKPNGSGDYKISIAHQRGLKNENGAIMWEDDSPDFIPAENGPQEISPDEEQQDATEDGPQEIPPDEEQQDATEDGPQEISPDEEQQDAAEDGPQEISPDEEQQDATEDGPQDATAWDGLVYKAYLGRFLNARDGRHYYKSTYSRNEAIAEIQKFNAASSKDYEKTSKKDGTEHTNLIDDIQPRVIGEGSMVEYLDILSVTQKYREKPQITYKTEPVAKEPSLAV